MGFCYPGEVYLRGDLRPKPGPNDLGRAMIAAISINEIEGVEPPLEHFHVPGVYGRKITVPANVVVVTKLHKSRHITIALTGKCTVVDQDGKQIEVEAPGIWITEPGTQRSVLCHTETSWITVHGVPEGMTDIPALEQLLVVDPFIEDRRRLAQAGDDSGSGLPDTRPTLPQPCGTSQDE
jgi:hypothetical protein